MMSDTTTTEVQDAEILQKRLAGRTFAAISRDLELRKPIDAQRAFQRAFRRLPSDEQDAVRVQESARLDRLAERVRSDTDKSDEDRTRSLEAIERLRKLTASA
jgi:hypothetical protein